MPITPSLRRRTALPEVGPSPIYRTPAGGGGDAANPDPRPRLLKAHGGIKQIPDDALAKAGVLRLFSEDTHSHSLVLKADFERDRSQCFAVLQKYPGYLFPHHRDRLYRFCRGE